MGLVRLAWMSLAMFISTFITGYLPLIFSRGVSTLKFKKLSILSAGLIIGTALTVIIPEGIESVYRYQESTSSCSATSSELQPMHDSNHRSPSVGLPLILGFILMFLIDQITAALQSSNKSIRSNTSLKSQLLQDEFPSANNDFESGPSRRLSDSMASVSNSNENLDDLIPHRSPRMACETDLSILLQRSVPLSPPSPPSRSFSTFVGFIFHSVADGIALGASSFSSSADQDYETIKSIPLDLVVFVAIVVHKAPAAFGLITYLMSMGLSKSKLRKILLAFSVAAPFGALMTWTTLTTMYKIKYGSIPDEPDFGKTEKVEWWAGMILLFSGGTFLYIATHALEDIRNRSMDSPCSFSPRLPKSPVNQSRDRLAQESNGRGAVNSEQKISLLMSSFLMVLGMVLPLILSSSLRHKH
ncbi:Zinc/iron permease [Phakopsora pachyrhizi]|uniref:Zinc/iron permease n=1 Tax=Phakopsora pachyrhizi TaxID=170000 RepID=A0AAV0BTN5_PHAPC|nr:Zinc/iron permease [Phakopsora pachyrhizi]